MDLLSLVAVDDSFEICGVHEAAIASKLAPTFEMHSPCGSEPARDVALQITANALANRFPRAPAAKSITP
jgi:hypothetical protein